MTQSKLWRTVAVAGPSMLVLALGGLIYESFLRNRREAAEVERTEAVARELAYLVERAKDAELGARGFYATGDTIYLAPYRNVEADVAESIGRLREMVVDRDQASRVAGLEATLAVRLAVIEENIAARLAGELSGAEIAARLERGSRLMAEGTSLMNTLRRAQAELVRASMETEARNARRLATLIVLGTVVAGLFSLFINALLTRHAAGQAEANQQIEQRNELLEEQALELESQVEELQSQAIRLEEMQLELEAGNAGLRQAHAEVVLREERFRALVENSSEIITVLDADGSVVYESPAIERVLGYAQAERVGTDNLAYVHAEDVERLRRDLKRLTAGGTPLRAEFRAAHRDGSYRVLSATYVNLVDEPAVGGIVVNTRDITALRESEERFRHSQKMEAVGRLAGGIAHDFNNLLMVIRGSTELALMDLAPDEAAREDLEEIEAAACRASNLTHQLLAISRQQVLEPRVVDLNGIISDLHRMLTRTLGEDVDFVTRLDPNLGRVLADPGQLEQVLMNLAVNARDAMPQGGKLITETRNVSVDASFDALSGDDVAPGDYVTLTVADTGVGMSREVRERVFEPFYTTKPPGAGTGLGLSTVYGIVKQSGGFVWVYSEPGLGTTFKVYLPRVREGVETRAEEIRPTLLDHPVTILLVEDEAPVRTITARMLKRLGHRVVEAENGEDALRMAEALGKEVDLVITDVVMPRMGGGELAARIRSRWPGTKVLFASGYTDEAVIRHGVLESREPLIQKPFHLNTLAEKISEVLAV